MTNRYFWVNLVILQNVYLIVWCHIQLYKCKCSIIRCNEACVQKLSGATVVQKRDVMCEMRPCHVKCQMSKASSQDTQPRVRFEGLIHKTV